MRFKHELLASQYYNGDERIWVWEPKLLFYYSAQAQTIHVHRLTEIGANDGRWRTRHVAGVIEHITPEQWRAYVEHPEPLILEALL